MDNSINTNKTQTNIQPLEYNNAETLSAKKINTQQEIAVNNQPGKNTDNISAINKKDSNDITAKELDEHLNVINNSLVNTNLKFERDIEFNVNVIKVVDKNTGEVVKQIPSKEAIYISKRIGDYMDSVGSLLLKDKA